jgi:hypothetical protein
MVTIPVCIGVSWLRAMPPFGVQGLAKEFRASRGRLKLDPPHEVQSGALQGVLVFVQEGASVRLLRRLWGLGLSRPAAARLLEYADACSLVEVVRAEERRAPTDTAGRLVRIQLGVRPFRRSESNPRTADPNFRVTDTTSITQACIDEAGRDLRLRNTIAYGGMLLQNRFDESGRIGGPAVYVMDLGERNELLRNRFGDRKWYRYELPRNRPDTMPVLVPYDSAP